jgi:hypothetical protein
MTAFWNRLQCRVFLLKQTDVSEVHTASAIRAMNKPQQKGLLDIQESRHMGRMAKEAIEMNCIQTP